MGAVFMLGSYVPDEKIYGIGLGRFGLQGVTAPEGLLADAGKRISCWQ
jgi:hypothetical protein